MMDKQELLIAFLKEQMNENRIGIIVKGVDGIAPEDIIKKLAIEGKHLYVVAVDYDGIFEYSGRDYSIANSVEKAVLWRSMPECAGNILVFIKNDTEKMHSLAEFEIITIRDVARFLVKEQIKSVNNVPTNNFWKALWETSDYYTFDALLEFVSAVNESQNYSEAIPQNMWRLNLLQDNKVMNTSSEPEERLAKNRDLIFAIGQLSEESRKRLSRSLAKVREGDKERLWKSYHNLQNFYKYGKKDTLKLMDFDTVQELFSASQKSSKKGSRTKEPGGGNFAPIRAKELGSIVSEALVSGTEEERGDLQNLCNEIVERYNDPTEENNFVVSSPDGIFGGRDIEINASQTDLRKLVGKFCNVNAWGGIMETSESALKDAISVDTENHHIFDPENKDSIIAFSGGVDGSQNLFGLIKQFDKKFNSEGLENVERFEPIIENLKEKRMKLISNLDMIMYYPVLFSVVLTKIAIF